VTERLEPERVDQEAVEADLESEAQAQADRAAEVQLVSVQDRAADQVVEVQVWAQDRAADQAAERKRPAPGLELAATMAARVLFREWSPVSRLEALVGAANRQKKSFSEFSGR
jgi:hypothetical protein